MAFYDCSAADDARDIRSDASSADASLSQGSVDGASSSKQQSRVSVSQDKPSSTFFVRAALAGIRADSKIFPKEIPQASPDENAAVIGTKIELLACFREVERTHKQVVLAKDDFADFADQLEKSKNGSQINTLVFLPLLTADNHLRAILIAGLNPNRPLDKEYQVFLDLFSATISGGITSSRLAYEEIRRSRFMAALIKVCGSS